MSVETRQKAQQLILHLNSIIRESYEKTDVSERPKIFGMTASPIDAKGNIAEAAL